MITLTEMNVLIQLLLKVLVICIVVLLGLKSMFGQDI
jgi:hypothetical protein